MESVAQETRFLNKPPLFPRVPLLISPPISVAVIAEAEARLRVTRGQQAPTGRGWGLGGAACKDGAGAAVCGP